MNSRRNMFLLLIMMGACKTGERSDSPQPGTYSYDAAFLRLHDPGTIELADTLGNSKVLLSARYQGRVMTSTAAGDAGTSFGWLNYNLISSGEKKAQFNPVGGEERFWLGPEGGQFSLYFHAGDSFHIKNWQVPALIDTVPFEVTRMSSREAVFSRNASLINYSGAIFDIRVERKVSLLGQSEIENALSAALPENIGFVGYRTENSVENTGPVAWTPETGLVSIWLLGMMTPSESTAAIIPFHPHKDARTLITTNYFGEIPSERLSIGDSILYFTCDGKYRSKIGLPPSIAKPMAASFDFQKNTLTFILFSVSKDAPYVNSKWEIQQEPFRGDVVNSYNDGPLPDGSQLGPFYELESSSPTLRLKSGEAGTYVQTTIHLTGDFAGLKIIAAKLLGVDLDLIKNQFQ